MKKTGHDFSPDSRVRSPAKSGDKKLWSFFILLVAGKEAREAFEFLVQVLNSPAVVRKGQNHRAFEVLVQVLNGFVRYV